MKTFPKKGAELQVLEAGKTQVDAAKTEITAFLADRKEILQRMYLDNLSVGNELWHSVYCGHLLMKKLTVLVIWQDDNNKFFQVNNEGIVQDVSGCIYVPVGNIRLAHVLNMENSDIDLWQKKLAADGRCLLIPQVWESVSVTAKMVPTLESCYHQVILTAKERNEFRKRKKALGIEVVAAEMEREYNPYTGRYDYSNAGAMNIGKSMTLSYTVDETTKDLTLGKIRILDQTQLREMFL